MKLITRKLDNYKFKIYLYPKRVKQLSLKIINKTPYIEINEFIDYNKIISSLILTLNEFKFLKTTLMYNVKNIKIYKRKLFIIPLKTMNRKISIIKLKNNQERNIILNDIEIRSLFNIQCDIYDKLDSIKY